MDNATNSASTLQAVLEYAGRGWRMFPVKPKDKTPLISEWQKRATSGPEQLCEWAKQYPGCNWAVATGPGSGIFVVDLDGKEAVKKFIALLRAYSGGRFQVTATATTARGWHTFYKYPQNRVIRNSAGKLAPGIDIRGDGGYVLVAPSIHPSGARYAWEMEVEIIEAPEWLLDKLTEKAAEQGGDGVGGGVCEGRRNSTLTSLAGSMRRRGMRQSAIEAALLDENQHYSPPLPEREVLLIARSVGRYPTSGDQSGPGPAPAWSPALTRLADVEGVAVDWFWKPYIAYGAVTMITGDPGVGKSYIALALSAATTVGQTPLGGQQRQPAAVLYLTVENSDKYVLRPRFDALGGDAKLFFVLRGAQAADGGEEERSITLADLDVLHQSIGQTEARLIVVDPIQSYLGATVDAHRANETRPILDGLVKLAEEFHLAILILRHAGKAGAQRAIHKGLGSIDFTGAVRSELFAGMTADKQQRALVHIKSNLGPYGETIGFEIGPPTGTNFAGQYRWTGRSDLNMVDLTQSDTELKSAVEEAEEFLRQVLGDGPALTKEVTQQAKQAGIRERTLDEAKGRLGVRSVKMGFGRESSWRWELPPVGAKAAKGANTQNLAPFDAGHPLKPTTTTTYSGSPKGAKGAKDAVLGEPAPFGPPMAKGTTRASFGGPVKCSSCGQWNLQRYADGTEECTTPGCGA